VLLGFLSEAFAAVKLSSNQTVTARNGLWGSAKYFTERHLPARVADKLPASTREALGFGSLSGPAGITALVSDGVPSSTIILADATQIAAASETITLNSSNETTLQMDTTPDSPPTASTAYVSLWQMNWRALRAERYFGAVKLGTTGVCVITSVNWIGGSPG
jgi:hypothetical protein